MPARPLTVVGIDGAPGGWLLARQEGLQRPTVRFLDGLDGVIGELIDGSIDVVGIDIPVGLSSDGNRPADQLARARLGPRRSTFFPTPVRSVLDAESWEHASAASRRAAGVGLSKQAWNLVPKIREVDRLWRRSIADSLVEVHPELSFAEMQGTPVMTKKSDPDGADQRRRLLAEHLTMPGLSGTHRRAFVDALVESMPRKLSIDTIDALAVLWSARRHALGRSVTLGGERDPLGRPMAVTI